MKEKFFKLEIITPFEIIYQHQVRHIRLPGTEGYFGVLAGHAPFITTLKIGEIKIDLENETKYFAVSGGLVEVLPHTTTVLVETAEEAAQIDIPRAQAAKMRAQDRLKTHPRDVDLARAKVAFERATNRLNISQSHPSTSKSPA